MTTKANASDLYGGKENIFKKLNDAVRSKLAKIKEENAQELERYIPISLGALSKLKSGEKDVDGGLFDLIQMSLDLDLYDIVGKPVFSDESRKYWEQRMIDSPMISTGPAVTLDLYVYLIMGTEICSDPFAKQGRWWEETAEDRRKKFEWWLKQQERR